MIDIVALRIIIIIYKLNLLSTEAGGLSTTRLQIIPHVVQRGRNVTMACLYQIHESEIYSVRWYKGTQEFYRYSPLDSPTTRVTPINGIKIDVSIISLM